ncbi:hypothetical protein I204_06421 [Kwoniella mangroviensis CBS 8886]|uniref:uncharacterized protein n=1 Tax=Kwoniella mangroviensis CBS 8507 TaxID=1296122 RepID=UPI00080CF671|nr:hypothetical protein I204_06421 [Kwoniella mangroviensis CBS 8886]
MSHQLLADTSNLPHPNAAVSSNHPVAGSGSDLRSFGDRMSEGYTASLFFHGISFVSSPTLEAFLLAKGEQETLSNALVEATCAIGAAKLAFPEDETGISSSRQRLDISKTIMSTIFNLVASEAATSSSDTDRQEKVLILIQMLMLRDAYVGDPDWLKAYQRFLTYLTVYETLGALSAKQAPVLLSCPNSLWLEDLPCAQEVIHADFGFSLPTLFLIANLATIIASGETSDLVYGFHRSHARIQQAGSSILELLVEVTIWTGSMINLLHPLLMAGEVTSRSQRHSLELILETAREKADTADVEIIHQASVLLKKAMHVPKILTLARHILPQVIKECWQRRDNGTGEESVFEVMGCTPPTNIL